MFPTSFWWGTVGVQLTASRHGDDSTLLAVGGQLEEALDWQHRHPAQWSV